MKWYCVSFEKILLTKIFSVRRTKQYRLMLASNGATCDKTNIEFHKKLGR